MLAFLILFVALDWIDTLRVGLCVHRGYSKLLSVFFVGIGIVRWVVS